MWQTCPMLDLSPKPRLLGSSNGWVRSGNVGGGEDPAAVTSQPAGAVADPRLPPGGGSATAQSRPGPGLTRQTPELQLRKPAQAQKTPNLNWKKKNWGEKANSLPSDSLYCDKDVNLNHKLLSLFHQLLCQNRTASHSWGSKLRTIILDLASDRGNKANTYFLLIDEEIWYWKVHVIKH